MEGIRGKTDEWDHRILAGIKQGPADCIMIDEVAAALKKDEKTYSPGFVRACSRNDTSQRGYWNPVDIGFM